MIEVKKRHKMTEGMERYKVDLMRVTEIASVTKCKMERVIRKPFKNVGGENFP